MKENLAPFRRREVVEIKDGVPIFADNFEETRKRTANSLNVELGLSKTYPEMIGEKKELKSERKPRLKRS